MTRPLFLFASRDPSAKYRWALISILAVAALTSSLIVFPQAFELSKNQDFSLYDSAARDFLAGDLLAPDFGRNAPGWPLFLALVYTFLGTSGYALAISQTLLFVLLVGITWAIARDIFDARAAFVAAAIAAIWPPLLFQVRHGSSTLLYVVIITLSALLFARAIRSGSIRYSLLSGLFLGFGALTDVVGFYLPVAFLAAGMISMCLKANHSSWRRRIAIQVLFLCAFAASIVPWTYRNALLFDDFSTQAPIIAKGEQRYLEPSNMVKAFRPFLVPYESLLWESVLRIFVFPAGLHNLDPQARFSYKEMVVSLLKGKESLGYLQPREAGILFLKSLIVSLHIAMLIGAFTTVWRLKKEPLALLALFLSLYIILAVTATVALANGVFGAITLPNGFLISATPILIVLAVVGYGRQIEINGKFSYNAIL